MLGMDAHFDQDSYTSHFCIGGLFGAQQNKSPDGVSERSPSDDADMTLYFRSRMDLQLDLIS